MSECAICHDWFLPDWAGQVVCAGCMKEKEHEPEAYPPSEVPDAYDDMIVEPPDPSERNMCESCGDYFTTYYHGRNRMIRRCKDCLAKKVKRTKAEKKARGDYTRPGPKPKNGSPTMVLKPIKESSSVIYYALDFTGREYLKVKLEGLAFENARTPELQLVWMLIKANQESCE